MPLPRLVPALLLASTAACQALAGEGEEPSSVPDLLRRGRYVQALEQAERAHREAPQDARAEREYRLASAAVLLERGRRLLFDDRDEEALEQFLEAQRIAPEEPAIADWIYNARQKLALYWYEQAMECQASADLERAREHLERSLEYLPEFERSRAALLRALLQLNYRAGMGEEYYEQGVRNLHEHLLDQADFAFSASLKYEPDGERAVERRELTREQLAEERAAIAAGLEERGIFAAARNEYRMALLLDAANAQAQAGYERAGREEQAAEHLREADWRTLRKEYDLARAALAEGRALTEQQLEAFDAAEQALEEALLGDLYDRARLLESDQRYEEAVVAYNELLGRAPYFRDAISRRDTLEEYVTDAAELYAQVLAASDPAEQRRLLLQIAVFWPDHRDVQRRLAELEATAPEEPAAQDLVPQGPEQRESE
jgi:tetratricopeptide (TPR) repeat protein